MNVPEHIAIIMDGNNRWAKKKFLPSINGHNKGVGVVRETIKHCVNLGVKNLTLFAFSSENKNRSDQEINMLFRIFLGALNQSFEKLSKHNIKLKIIGDMNIFPKNIQKSAADAQKKLKNNTGLVLIIAANYGGRWDILQATKKIANLVKNNAINVDDIDYNCFEKYLSTANQPQVDLLIRTSGELRISNFLLWSIAYSELYFTDVLWPDFDKKELDKAIKSFNQRERRFGGRNQ